jgi:hypothetical protein
MRLWSLHPRYLDRQGLTALWREALLAQAVLLGKTRGYRHHPQLRRFLATADPGAAIAAYLAAVHAEAARRGYRYDAGKIGPHGDVASMEVARGQLEYEWRHLLGKLRQRSPDRLAALEVASLPEPHPSFRVVAGGVADWEVVTR